MKFKTMPLPQGGTARVPEDVCLEFPAHSSLETAKLHFLVSIPWDDSYLSRVEEKYREFFKTALPHLHARTTDVHIAICMPFIKELIGNIEISRAKKDAKESLEEINEQMVSAAFILHDSGWSKMSEQEIAASLGVSGLELNDTAMGPKEKHVVLGKQIAEDILSIRTFNPPLTDVEKEGIYQAILYHDKPWELAESGDVPLFIKLVCDVDHLWSFTHENFWQDTIRKGIDPETYLENLENDLDGYFVTEEGKAKARALLEERAEEVAQWTEAL